MIYHYFIYFEYLCSQLILIKQFPFFSFFLFLVKGVIRCTIEKNGEVNISGDFCRLQIIKCVTKIWKKDKQLRWSILFNDLAKKTEARSTSNTAFQMKQIYYRMCKKCYLRRHHHNEKPMT